MQIMGYMILEEIIKNGTLIHLIRYVEFYEKIYIPVQAIYLQYG